MIESCLLDFDTLTTPTRSQTIFSFGSTLHIVTRPQPYSDSLRWEEAGIVSWACLTGGSSHHDHSEQLAKQTINHSFLDSSLFYTRLLIVRSRVTVPRLSFHLNIPVPFQT